MLSFSKGFISLVLLYVELKRGEINAENFSRGWSFWTIKCRHNHSWLVGRKMGRPFERATLSTLVLIHWCF